MKFLMYSYVPWCFRMEVPKFADTAPSTGGLIGSHSIVRLVPKELLICSVTSRSSEATSNFICFRWGVAKIDRNCQENDDRPLDF